MGCRELDQETGSTLSSIVIERRLTDSIVLSQLSRDRLVPLLVWCGGEPFGAADGAGTRRVRRRSILVVDDSELVNRITEMILTRAGYRVRCIASPFELYDKTKEEPTDLVLVDYNMPLRGDQVIATARRAGVTAPMILYSNAPEDILREAVRVSGASGFVSKGVAAEIVVQQVADAFARLVTT